jgi:cell division protease FtsH
MNPFKALADALKSKNGRFKVLLGLILVSGFMFLTTQAEKEVKATKSAVQLQFEKEPASWMKTAKTTADLARALDAKKVDAAATVHQRPGIVLVTAKGGEKYHVSIPGCTIVCGDGTILDKLSESSIKDNFPFVDVHADVTPPTAGLLKSLLSVAASLGSLAALILAFYIINRMAGKDGANATMLEDRPTIKFKDVIGNAEAKQALARVQSFMQDPKRYEKIGAKAPRGVLLVGPPGTGKTLLAKALAGENDAKFISVDGSYFSSKYYGVGINKVRDLFDMARKNAPCVLFIDEIDGIGRRASEQGMGGQSENNRIINRILVELDGFSGMENVIVVGATNHEDNLDEALRRPGRFDMTVRLQLPTLPDRAKLFDLYLEKLEHEKTIDTLVLGRMTAGMSPADIANMVNKAAATAAETGAEQVTHEHLLRAIETQQLGGEVSGIKDLLSPATRKRLAYHEAGHALVAHWLKSGVVERVTIEPRGPALGVTYVTRENEDPLYVQGEYASRLAMMLAGREAELLVLDSVSSGASDDLKRATEMAISMVGSLGFSKSFGLLSVAGVPKDLMAPSIQSSVLEEARNLLEQAQSQCLQVLRDRRPALDALAEALLAEEVISGEALKELLNLEPPAVLVAA